jgi:exodeoxyribonuclease X
MRIRVIDLETTGTEPPPAPASGICEIGWCDVVSTEIQEDFLEGVKRPSGWIVEGPSRSVLVHPGVLIPPEVSAVHHITDEDVIKAAPLAGLELPWRAPDVDVLAAHSAKFERQFISDESTGGKPWICTYKCALRLWKEEPHHSNQALRYSRKPAGLDRAIANVAHRAGPDAYVTAFHLRDMLNEGHKIEHLVARSYQPALLITCHIGKERGKKWEDVDSGFLSWMLDKDFDEDALFTARHHLEERRKAAAGGA